MARRISLGAALGAALLFTQLLPASASEGYTFSAPYSAVETSQDCYGTVVEACEASADAETGALKIRASTATPGAIHAGGRLRAGVREAAPLPGDASRVVVEAVVDGSIDLSAAVGGASIFITVYTPWGYTHVHRSASRLSPRHSSTGPWTLRVELERNEWTPDVPFEVRVLAQALLDGSGFCVYAPFFDCLVGVSAPSRSAVHADLTVKSIKVNVLTGSGT